MVCGSHAKTRAMYSTPPCPSLATSTAAYRRRSFSDSQPKNRFIFCSTSAEYPSMPHSLIRGLLCSKGTAAQAIREVILDHILSGPYRDQGPILRREGEHRAVQPRRQLAQGTAEQLDALAHCYALPQLCGDFRPQLQIVDDDDTLGRPMVLHGVQRLGAYLGYRQATTAFHQR